MNAPSYVSIHECIFLVCLSYWSCLPTVYKLSIRGLWHARTDTRSSIWNPRICICRYWNIVNSSRSGTNADTFYRFLHGSLYRCCLSLQFKLICGERFLITNRAMSLCRLCSIQIRSTALVSRLPFILECQHRLILYGPFATRSFHKKTYCIANEALLPFIVMILVVTRNQFSVLLSSTVSLYSKIELALKCKECAEIHEIGWRMLEKLVTNILNQT